MAVFAYCLTCARLVPVKPGNHKHAGSRERAWYPYEHDGEDGKPCAGVKRGI